MRQLKIKERQYPFFLLLLILFHLSTNLIWINNNTYPGLSEEGGQLSFITHLYRDSHYKQNYTNIEWIKRLINNRSDRPPLFYLVSLSLIQILGFRYAVCVITNSLFFIFLILATYNIGKHLGNKTVGLWSAIIVSFYLPIYVNSHTYDMVLATTTLVSCAILAFLETNCFTKRRNSIICGIIMGLGLLTKQTFVIFILGPLVYYIYILKKEHTKERLINFSSTILLSVFIALIFYHPLIFHIQHVIKESTYKLFHTFYYLELLFQQVLSPYSFLLFICGVYSCLKHVQGKEKYPLFTWIVISLLILSISPSKRDRYFIPLLPAFAIITAYGIHKITFKSLKTILYGLSLYFGIFWFFAVNFPVNLTYFEKNKDNFFHRFGKPKGLLGNNLHPIKGFNIDGLLEYLENFDPISTNIALVNLERVSHLQWWIFILLTEHLKNTFSFILT